MFDKRMWKRKEKMKKTNLHHPHYIKQQSNHQPPPPPILNKSKTVIRHPLPAISLFYSNKPQIVAHSALISFFIETEIDNIDKWIVTNDAIDSDLSSYNQYKIDWKWCQWLLSIWFAFSHESLRVEFKIQVVICTQFLYMKWFQILKPLIMFMCLQIYFNCTLDSENWQEFALYIICTLYCIS